MYDLPFEAMRWYYHGVIHFKIFSNFSDNKQLIFAFILLSKNEFFNYNGFVILGQSYIQ